MQASSLLNKAAGTMPPCTTAQSKVIERLQAGAHLSLDSKTGRYVLTDVTGKAQALDQRPVLAMLRNGVLQQDMTGRCLPAET